MDPAPPSSLSPESLVGYGAAILLLLSVALTRMTHLRTVAAAAGLLGIIHAAMTESFIGILLGIAFVAINIGQLVLLARRRKTAQFTDEERMFREHVVPLLDPALVRRLLDTGEWRSAEPGTVLIRHGEMVTHMLFIVSGEIAVTVNDVLVGYCDPGSLVGEISVLTDMPATATVVARTPARYLAFERHKLLGLMDEEPAIEQAIDQSFRKGIRQKLASTNDALVDAEVRAAESATR